MIPIISLVMNDWSQNTIPGKVLNIFLISRIANLFFRELFLNYILSSFGIPIFIHYFSGSSYDYLFWTIKSTEFMRWFLLTYTFHILFIELVINGTFIYSSNDYFFYEIIYGVGMKNTSMYMVESNLLNPVS